MFYVNMCICAYKTYIYEYVYITSASEGIGDMEWCMLGHSSQCVCECETERKGGGDYKGYYMRYRIYNDMCDYIYV